MSPIELRHLLENLGQESTTGGDSVMAAPSATTTLRAEGLSKAGVSHFQGAMHYLTG